jgi:hypothetical protein
VGRVALLHNQNCVPIVRTIIAVAVAALVMSCAEDVQRFEAVGPVITLELGNLADFEQARHRAEHLCRSHYGRGAEVLRSERGAEADSVTFACVAP